jgi:hypothetical protein
MSSLVSGEVRDAPQVLRHAAGRLAREVVQRAARIVVWHGGVSIVDRRDSLQAGA